MIHKSAWAICVQRHFGVIWCTCLNLLSHNICVIRSCVTHDNLPIVVGLLVDVQFGIERFVTIQKMSCQTTQIQLVKVSQTFLNALQLGCIFTDKDLNNRKHADCVCICVTTTSICADSVYMTVFLPTRQR